MPLFFIDYWYLVLVVPALILTAVAQFKVHSTFKKYSQVGTRSGMSGAEASMTVQRQNGIQVPVEMTHGNLSDHYDPRSNVIRLSETVYDVRSIAAIGVAAHETGHALQYAQGYGPIKVRNAIVPVTQFASGASFYLVLLGLLLFEPLAYLGVALFGFSVVFQLITLPVEFNASRRAVKILDGYMDREELSGVKSVLSAAAMTYVAALVSAIFQLIRLLAIVGGGRDRK